MNRIFVAIVAAGIAFGSTAGFAADAAKKPELTKEDRAEMRNRAERLTAERAQPAVQPNTAVGTTHKATKPRTTKSGSTKHAAKKPAATKTGATKSGTTKPGKGTTPAVKKDEPKA